MRAAPAVSCANSCIKKHAHEHTGSAEASDFPCAVVYGLYRALPGDPDLLVTVAGAIASADLTPTLRHQDHTTLPSALASPVSRAKASTASRTDVRDVRETPLLLGRDAMDID